MCGIFGAVSDQPVVGTLIEGLKRLEYRGYDSAGIATMEDGGLNRVCAVGHVSVLEARVGSDAPAGTIGIAHTRWATHGEPSDRNAHPHLAAGVAVAHNGIVENYRELRAGLAAAGCAFKSETDTEVIPWLIGRGIEAGASPEKALDDAVSRLEGSYAVVAMSERDPDSLFAVRKGSPMALGVGDGGAFLASDPNALAGYARTAVMLEDGDRATIRVSAGVAAAPVHGSTRETLLFAADSALYAAKATGRNRVVTAWDGESGEARPVGPGQVPEQAAVIDLGRRVSGRTGSVRRS
jgi:glucosamine--fructose-6-phosphate aminotransferase (isomerizing)